MQLSNLYLFQNDIRYSHEQLFTLAKFAETNSFTNIKPISILRTSGDLKHYIRDGLHRCIAIYLAGRELLTQEYVIEPRNKIDLNSISYKNGYFTPFNIRTEVRLADLTEFREGLKLEIVKSKDIKYWIWDNQHIYKTIREWYHDNIIDFLDEKYPNLRVRYEQYKNGV